jgi:hypothetical protein
MINLSKLQWIVVGVVALIVIVLLDVLIGTTVTPRLVTAPTPTPTMPATVLFVRPEANGDCRENWFHACDLQTALSKARPDEEIWVLEGTYKPTSEKDQMATFQLKSGVALYGGFAGKETSRDERNWEENITILSGDIGTTGDSSDNSYHVVTGSGTHTTAVLDGFTITEGFANGDTPNDRGGGMYNEGGSPTLVNVVFSGNSAWAGGGMSNYDNSSPNLTNVTFSGNSAGVYGGGMFNGTESNSQLTDVTFSGNTAADSGGGMHNYSSSPVLIATQFINNTAPLGGGMFNHIGNPTLTNTNFISNTAKQDGGGIYNLSSSPILTSTEFISNAATQDGGGMYNTGSSPTLTNVIFSGNQAHSALTDHGGGGMYNTSSSPMLTNVTFSGNSAQAGGGMYNEGGSEPTLINCILWGNGPEIYNEDNSTTEFSYSLVKGENCPEKSTCKETKFNANPEFVKPDKGDLHLQPGSPAIDNGTNDGAPGHDLDQNPRPLDGNGDGNAITDMGAYEYLPN